MTVNGSTLTSDDATTVEGADVALADVNDAFFTDRLGFVYGATADEPWKTSGMAYPILYFEEIATGISLDMNTAEMHPSEEIKLTATVTGAEADRVRFITSDDGVAEIVAVEYDGNTAIATVRCVAEGTATITAEIDGQTASCQITATSTGIDDVEADDDMEISVSGRSITAPSAVRIEVFGISGNKVASAAGGRADVSSLPSGIYVVAATDAAGKREVVKVVLK